MNTTYCLDDFDKMSEILSWWWNCDDEIWLNWQMLQYLMAN